MRAVDGSFEWTQDDGLSPNRFAGVADLVGGDAWEALFRGNDPLRAWDGFLDDTRQARHRSYRPARLFISHKHEDTALAVRLAARAKAAGVRYWLDVQDPLLASVTDPTRQAVLIAAIIEMALLNCSAIVALHTTHSSRSRWIPYEFGRVKEHLPVSDRASVWFDVPLQPLTGQEYLELAWRTYDGPGRPPGSSGVWEDIDSWLRRLMPGPGAVQVRRVHP